MNLCADDLSRWEFCARLVPTYRDVLPLDLTVRRAAMESLPPAIRALLSGVPADRVADTAVAQYLESAAYPGYLYPKGVNHHDVARDHASWLDSAIRLVDELNLLRPIPLPNLHVDGHSVSVDGWIGPDEAIHTFRVTRSPEADPSPRWPELVAHALGTGRALIRHSIPLPGIERYRLASPIATGFLHPLTGQVRLAKIDNETGKKFGVGWKRIGRWELPEVPWSEWRDGLDRDQ